MRASDLPVLVTQDQYEWLLLRQELEQERAVYDWEAPFPMSQRTQRDLAENEQRIIREGIARIRAILMSEDMVAAAGMLSI